MRLRPLIGLIAAAVLALPAAALAYVITIDGFDPVTTAAPPAGPAGPNPNNPYPGMFVGLGDCVGPGFDNSCTGSPVISNNPLDTQAAVDSVNALNNLIPPNAYTYAAIAGFGFKLDQVIFHTFSQTDRKSVV